MNVLDKILEEIEERVNFRECLVKYEKRRGTITDVCRNKGALEELDIIAEIIRSHMDEAADDWIPVEDGLPEEHKSMFAKLKGTHMWNNAMFEKVSDEVNVTIELEDGTRKTTTSHTLDGKWKVEKECVVNKKVIAWRPLPEPYKPKKLQTEEKPVQ